MPAGFGPRAPLAEDLPVAEQARDLLERPRAAVGGDDRARPRATSTPLLALEALRRDLEDLPGGVGGRGAHRRAHRRQRRRAARERRVRPARRVAELHLDAVEREAELLGGDLRHRRPRAGADVLHRGDDVRAAVGADADPCVARAARRRRTRSGWRARRRASRSRPSARAPRPAAPSAARRGGSTPSGSWPSTAGRRSCRRARSSAGAARAGRCRAARRARRAGTRARPRALDEARRAERRHRRQVQLRAVLDRAHVVAGVEHLHRPRRATASQPSQPSDAMNSPPSAIERPVRRGPPRVTRWIGRVAVARRRRSPRAARARSGRAGRCAARARRRCSV